MVAAMMALAMAAGSPPPASTGKGVWHNPENSVAVQGCLIGGFPCKTQTWRRG
jgi:hypothetical protein